jgi:chromosome segregation ATPase
MITLTEKRIKDLENKASEYEVRISNLKKNLEEFTSFPQEFEVFKSLCKVLREQLDTNIGLTHKGQAELAKQAGHLHDTLLVHTEDLRKHKDAIDCVNVNIATLSGQIEEGKTKLEKLALDGKLTLTKLNLVETSLQVHEKIVRKLDEFSDIASYKLNALQAQSSALFSKSSENENDLKNLQIANKTSIDSLNVYIGNATNDLRLQIEKLPVPILPKSYDAEIAEIRKDIAETLALLHSTASKTLPPAPKVDEKIQAMETAIAQIYGLLKKYETR